MFSSQDLEQLEGMGLTPADLERQLQIFSTGTENLDLLRPCTPGDGILRLSPDLAARCQSLFARARAAGRVSKFVPASGAATRMFKDLFQELERLRSGQGQESPTFQKFRQRFGEFAFCDELRACLETRGHELGTLVERGDFLPILEAMLDEDGLCYGNTPKGLLPFHRDPEGPRTPMEEHFHEARAYALDEHGRARLHFTVSSEHLERFQSFIEKVRGRHEQPGFHLEIEFSVQKESTNTLAVDLENQPLRDANGRLVFRPGGHGSLIENLNELNADIVFIKNIDNVTPERLRADTILYKQILGGYLIYLGQKIGEHLRRLKSQEFTASRRDALLTFLAEELGCRPGQALSSVPLSRARETILELLNRPLRVCGMVKNEGEPGGGPFWVRDQAGESLQIVESSQVNPRHQEQQSIWQTSTHFNPVDLVCGLRDFNGEPFDLRAFVDPRTCFISEKSSHGKPLKALEWPGLWNGAMARWNTVFVEVPATTFTPVKSVLDLLRPEHQ